MMKGKSLEKIIESQQEVSIVDCAKKQGNSKQLSGKDIGGIFIVHCIFLAIATVLALWQLKNPHTISKVTDFSEKTKVMTRRLSDKVLNMKESEEFNEEINKIDATANSEVNDWQAHGQNKKLKDYLPSEQNVKNASFVSWEG